MCRILAQLGVQFMFMSFSYVGAAYVVVNLLFEVGVSSTVLALIE